MTPPRTVSPSQGRVGPSECPATEARSPRAESPVPRLLRGRSGSRPQSPAHFRGFSPSAPSSPLAGGGGDWSPFVPSFVAPPQASRHSSYRAAPRVTVRSSSPVPEQRSEPQAEGGRLAQQLLMKLHKHLEDLSENQAEERPGALRPMAMDSASVCGSPPDGGRLRDLDIRGAFAHLNRSHARTGGNAVRTAIRPNRVGSMGTSNSTGHMGCSLEVAASQPLPRISSNFGVQGLPTSDVLQDGQARLRAHSNLDSSQGVVPESPRVFAAEHGTPSHPRLLPYEEHVFRQESGPAASISLTASSSGSSTMAAAVVRSHSSTVPCRLTASENSGSFVPRRLATPQGRRPLECPSPAVPSPLTRSCAGLAQDTWQGAFPESPRVASMEYGAAQRRPAYEEVVRQESGPAAVPAGSSVPAVVVRSLSGHCPFRSSTVEPAFAPRRCATPSRRTAESSSATTLPPSQSPSGVDHLSAATGQDTPAPPDGMLLDVGSYTCGGKKLRSPGWVSQDAYLTLELRDNCMLVAVFDGHGPMGHFAASHIRELFVQLGPAKLSGASNAAAALSQLFTSVDDVLRCEGKWHEAGSTAVCAVIDRNSRSVTVAHVGDSPLLLAHGGNLVFSTKCHKFDETEEHRINTCGGEVRVYDGCRRLFVRGQEYPGLSMSRAFGDFIIKDHGLIAEPDISPSLPFPPGSTLVLSSDGVSDILPPANLISMAMKDDAQSAAFSLILEARSQWPPNMNIDDMTAVVVRAL